MSFFLWTYGVGFGVFLVVGLINFLFEAENDKNYKQPARLVLASPFWPVMMTVLTLKGLWMFPSFVKNVFSALFQAAEIVEFIPKKIRPTPRASIEAGSLSEPDAEGGELSEA